MAPGAFSVAITARGSLKFIRVLSGYIVVMRVHDTFYRALDLTVLGCTQTTIKLARDFILNALD